MGTPYLSEIRVFSFNFAPKGWAQCNGQLLPINQNQALFALLGTMYGGNGQTNFALPNLRGRVAIHTGNGHTMGEAAGSTSVTVNIQQLANHMHPLMASPNSANTTADPTNAFLAPVNSGYAAPSSAVTTLSPQTVSSVGGSQAHNNMMPYEVLNYCIALQGVFPSQN